MGDDPRWVDNFYVDSAAMYQAYLQYQARTCMEVFQDETKEKWAPVWWGHLRCIKHRAILPPWAAALHIQTLPEPGVNSVNCTQRHCIRCTKGNGGYQLLSYSPCWGKEYNIMKEEGSWAAPEPRRILDQELFHWVPQQDGVRAAP